MFPTPCFYGCLLFSYMARLCRIGIGIAAVMIVCRTVLNLVASFSREFRMRFRLVRQGEITTMSGREDYSSEFYGLPEYVITHIRVEKLRNSNRRVYHWEERNGMLVPAFMAFIATPDLVIMNDVVQESLIDFVPRMKANHH